MVNLGEKALAAQYASRFETIRNLSVIACGC